VEKSLREEKIDTEIFQIGNGPVHGCSGCNACEKTGRCIHDDDPANKMLSLMKEADLEGMKTEIKRRERDLKGSRSKTLHPGEFDPNAWFGGGQLDYRFNNAKVIIKDIFESEGIYAKSE
jgi:hypothetical protein